MTDRYTTFVSGGFGKKLAKQLGLPTPVRLRRYAPGEPLCEGPVAVVGEGPYAAAVTAMLAARDISTEPGDGSIGGLVIDLAQLRTPEGLVDLRGQASALVKRLARNARVVVIGTAHELLTDPSEVATQRALDGFTRSLAKELRAGATANLIAGPLEPNIAAVLGAVEFFLSGRSAFVDGQRVRVGEDDASQEQDAERPLAGKVAVVTGAARGIGAAIVEVLARDGATVVGVDVPAAQEALAAVVNQARGSALALDVTSPDAGQRILDHCRQRHGGLDVVVHNAGITRDKLFVNMDDQKWASVLAVNLQSILTMNQTFLAPDGLPEGGRIVCLSSQSGFAGNRGQTNYAATKAAIIGLVDASAAQVADRRVTVNAVAPGLIETDMTAKMPFATREVARRLSSLQQGGQPRDVAETIAWLAQPASAAISGQTVRVCGQNMVGA